MVSSYESDTPSTPDNDGETSSGSLVYIVDKDSMLGNVIEGFLNQNGLRPKFFTDSETALQTLKDDPEKPVLLLTNLLMNGLNLIERSKRVEPNLKTLLFDRNAGEETLGESSADCSFKPDGFLRDPLLLEILVTTVKSILEDRESITKSHSLEDKLTSSKAVQSSPFPPSYGNRKPEAESKFGSRILIVDDEPSIRTLLKKCLNLEGYEIEEAKDGETAFEKIKEFEPHIVLLDILMPGTPGNELVGKIKQWKPGIEIIMITAASSEVTKEKCLLEGAFEVVTKPCTFAPLKTAINNVIENRLSQLGGVPANS